VQCRLCRPRDIGPFLAACILTICGVPRVAGIEVFSFSGITLETLPSFLALSNQSLVSLLRQQTALEQFETLWNILGTKPSFLGEFFSAFQV